MTVLVFVCSRPTSSSSVRWLWQSSVLLRPWNCLNVIISVIILCISIGMIRYICWLEGICMLYWRPVHRRLKGIGAPCLQRFGAPCLPFLYFTGNSFKYLYFFQGWYDICNIIVVIRQSEWAICTKLLILFFWALLHKP